MDDRLVGIVQEEHETEVGCRVCYGEPVFVCPAYVEPDTSNDLSDEEVGVAWIGGYECQLAVVSFPLFRGFGYQHGQLHSGVVVSGFVDVENCFQLVA